MEIGIKYEGFLARQEAEIKKLNDLDEIKIPPDFDYGSVAGLKTEIRDKLSDLQPLTLGHASRMPGVTPAALSILMIYLEKDRREA